MEYSDDQTLIQHILNGNTQAFSVLVQKYQRSVYSLIRQIVSGKEDAEELTQDVFVKVFRKLDSFRGGSSFSTWLYRIAWNTAISNVRKQRIVYPELDESLFVNIPNEAVDDVLEKEEDEEKLQRLEIAVDKLQPEERALIALYYTESKSISEIASILGQSGENVKVRLHRTRKKIVFLLNQDKQ